MSIGILMFATAGYRIKGDPGFLGTFEFPVEYGIVEGSYRDLIDGSQDICQKLCQTAKKLEIQGVTAIAGDCGLIALYQQEIVNSVHIPVISSSLVLLPLIRNVISSECSIGILTGHSNFLSMYHLNGVKAAELKKIVIQGMQDEPHFQKVVIEGSTPQQYNLMRDDVLHAVKKLLGKCEHLGAVLLECSNLAAFGAEISKEFRIPVFDINTAIMMLWEVGNKRSYEK